MDTDIEIVNDPTLAAEVKKLSKKAAAKSCRRFNGRIHIASTIMVIMFSMMILDGYLVEQNEGNRKTGVMVMLLIGDVCLLFVLRYVGVWVGTEVHSAQRGCSMAEWFLFVFVLDIKIYFVMEGVRKGCFQLLEDENTAENNLPELSPYGQGAIYGDIISTCDYSLLMKKSLTLFQSICIPSLYILLVGADYLENLSDFRSLEEVKMRTFWVVADLLDLVDLQATVWEAKQGEPPYLTVGFIYFYCYIVLIILPPLSLAEMSKGKEMRPHAMIVYLIASFVTVNVATTCIRTVLLISYGLGTVSAVFIGKNVICTAMKITKLLQIYLIKRKRLRFTQDEETAATQCQVCAYRENNISDKCNPGNGGMELKTKDEKPRPYYMYSDDESTECSNKQNPTSNPFSPHKDWKPPPSECNSGEFSRNNLNTFGGVVNLVTKLNRFSKQTSTRGPSSLSSLECAQQSPCDSIIGKRNFNATDSYNEASAFRNEFGERSSLLVHSGSASSIGAIDYPFPSSEKKVRFRRDKDGMRKAIPTNLASGDPLGENGKLSNDARSPATEQSCSTATTESGIIELRENHDSRPPSYLKVRPRNGLYRLSEVVSTEEQVDDGLDRDREILPGDGSVARSTSMDRSQNNNFTGKTLSRSDSVDNERNFIIPISNGTIKSQKYSGKEYELSSYKRKDMIRSCEMLDERLYLDQKNCEQFAPNQSIYSKSVCTMPLPRRKVNGINGGVAFYTGTNRKIPPEAADSDGEYTTV